MALFARFERRLMYIWYQKQHKIWFRQWLTTSINIITYLVLDSESIHWNLFIINCRSFVGGPECLTFVLLCRKFTLSSCTPKYLHIGITCTTQSSFISCSTAGLYALIHWISEEAKVRGFILLVVGCVTTAAAVFVSKVALVILPTPLAWWILMLVL